VQGVHPFAKISCRRKIFCLWQTGFGSPFLPRVSPSLMLRTHSGLFMVEPFLGSVCKTLQDFPAHDRSMHPFVKMVCRRK